VRFAAAAQVREIVRGVQIIVPQELEQGAVRLLRARLDCDVDLASGAEPGICLGIGLPTLNSEIASMDGSTVMQPPQPRS
jgi:hypothetical protein